MSLLDPLGDYDRWKLASPDEEHGDPDFYCEACGDSGWVDDDGRCIFCPECGADQTLDDISDEAELEP